MAILTKYYDYEIKKEAYKLTGEKGYARNTTTLLEFVSVTDTTMDYCTATYKVNVVGDRADSQIVIYDNGVLIPFTYNNTEMNFFEWSNQNTNEATITIKLTYDTTHEIQAKYLGNTRCVPSKSPILSLFEEKPATARTTLALSFNTASRIYTSSDTITCSATLSIVDTSINPNANRNQYVKFYVDGVLNGSSQTNNSGVASYTLSNVSIGYHTVTASYEGSSYLFKSETSSDISKGYKIDVLDYPTYVLNSGDISVTAQLTDFFDNPQSSKTLYLANSSNTSLGVSASTNSEGKATITMNSSKYSSIQTGSNNVYTVPYKVRYSANEYSTAISTTNATNMILDLEQNIDYISATNQSVEVSGLVSPLREGVFPVDVTINVNGSTGTVKTDATGKFVYNYLGQGSGDIVLSASINGDNDTVEIEDLLQYWTANNVSYNKRYYSISGEFRELTNGFKLEFPSSLIQGGVSVGIGDGSTFEQDFELSFDVVGSANMTQIGVKQWKKGTNVTYAYAPTHETVAVGDSIKAISEEGTIKVYKNDVEISSTTALNYYPCIWFEGNKKGAYLLFDNLKLKVI